MVCGVQPAYILSSAGYIAKTSCLFLLHKAVIGSGHAMLAVHAHIGYSL